MQTNLQRRLALALHDLFDCMGAGEEFPDACSWLARVYAVPYDVLRDAYDAAHQS